MVYSQFNQLFPPKSLFETDSIEDLTGKTALVTGANIGIGLETARVLLSKGARVYIACRSEEKAQAAIATLKESTGKEAHFLKLDLGNIKAAKEAAQEFMKKETKLNLLFNNAGVMMPPAGSKTFDGYELQWGTNCLGPYIFTETLLPLLVSTAAASPPNSVRIITTSSSAHQRAPPVGIDVEDTARPTGMQSYGQSKLGNIVMGQHWANQLKDQGVVSVSVHPGVINTGLWRNMIAPARIFMNLTTHPVEKGALTQLYAGTSPAVTLKQSGSFYVPWARLDSSTRSETSDVEFCMRVMGLMKEQVDAKLS